MRYGVSRKFRQTALKINSIFRILLWVADAGCLYIDVGHHESQVDGVYLPV